MHFTDYQPFQSPTSSLCSIISNKSQRIAAGVLSRGFSRELLKLSMSKQKICLSPSQTKTLVLWNATYEITTSFKTGSSYDTMDGGREIL